MASDRDLSVSAGVKGGLAGGVAMAVLACTYGLLKMGSIWYPINFWPPRFTRNHSASRQALEFLSR